MRGGNVMALKDLRQQYIDELTSIYDDAKHSLIATIGAKNYKGNVTFYEKSLKKQIQAEIDRLNKSGAIWAKNANKDIYDYQSQYMHKHLKNLGMKSIEYDSFNKLHSYDISLLINNSIQDLVTANNYLGRKMNDVIREATLKASAMKLATGATTRQAQLLIKSKLIAEGITEIKMKNGKVMQLDNYAKLIARTTTTEASNKATFNKLQEDNFDLVKMSEHLGSCSMCAPYQGKVFSISGKDDKFPSLYQTVLKNGYNTVHPNCAHSFMPYIAALQSDEELDKMSQISNDIPDDVNDIKAKNAAIYMKTQAKNKIKQEHKQIENTLGMQFPDNIENINKVSQDVQEVKLETLEGKKKKQPNMSQAQKQYKEAKDKGFNSVWTAMKNNILVENDIYTRAELNILQGQYGSGLSWEMLTSNYKGMKVIAKDIVKQQALELKAATKAAKLQAKALQKKKAKFKNSFLGSLQDQAEKKGIDLNPHLRHWQEIEDFKDEMKSYVQEKVNYFVNTFKQEYRSAVNTYTGSAYDTINKVLRGKAATNYMDRDHYECIKNVQEAFRSIPGSDLDLKLYRNTRSVNSLLSPDAHIKLTRALERMKKGNEAQANLMLDEVKAEWLDKILSDKGIISTSRSQTGYAGSADFRMEIMTPKGTKLLYAEGMSHFQSEREILMNMGSEFYLHDIKIEKRRGGDDGLKVVLYVQRNPFDTDDHVTNILQKFEKENGIKSSIGTPSPMGENDLIEFFDEDYSEESFELIDD